MNLYVRTMVSKSIYEHRAITGFDYWSMSAMAILRLELWRIWAWPAPMLCGREPRRARMPMLRPRPGARRLQRSPQALERRRSRYPILKEAKAQYAKLQ
jgi:hypothetical protein